MPPPDQSDRESGQCRPQPKTRSGRAGEQRREPQWLNSCRELYSSGGGLLQSRPSLLQTFDGHRERRARRLGEEGDRQILAQPAELIELPARWALQCCTCTLEWGA